MPSEESTVPYYKEKLPQQLRSFYYVAKNKSYTKAAQEMGYAQPTVWQQSKALQDALDVQLLSRVGNQIELTAEGKILFELAQPVIEQLDSIKEAFDERRGMVEKRLTIASGESGIIYLLPEIIDLFKQQFSDVDLVILSRTAREILSLLRDDEIDLGLTSLRSIPSDIEYRDFRHYNFILITPLDHPLATKTDVTPQDIAAYPLILPEKDSTTSQRIDDVFKSLNLSYKVVMETGGWEIIKRYVGLGLGISIVSDICLDGSNDETLNATSVSQYFGKRSYGIASKKGKHLPVMAKEFLNILGINDTTRYIRTIKTLFH